VLGGGLGFGRHRQVEDVWQRAAEHLAGESNDGAVAGSNSCSLPDEVAVKMCESKHDFASVVGCKCKCCCKVALIFFHDASKIEVGFSSILVRGTPPPCPAE
jgi:hypothetical protein